MFKNKKIKFYSSKIAADETSSTAVNNSNVPKDLFSEAIEATINKLKQTLDKERDKEQQRHLEQLIQQCKSILGQLSEPKKVVSEIALLKDENNIIEEATFQTDMDKNSQEKSIALLQAIRKKELKPLQPQSKTGEINHAAINSLGNDPRKFAVNENILLNVKLKPSVTTKYVSSSNGIDPELEEKLTKRALLDQQDNINTGNVSDSKEIIVATESVNTKKTSQEHVFPLAEQSLKVKSINQNDIQKQLPQNEENLSVNENTSNKALPVISEETDSSLNSLSELEKEKNQIALEEKLQELSDAQKLLEVLLQSLKDPADCNVSSLNAGYFKKSSSTDDVIVRAVLKP